MEGIFTLPYSEYAVANELSMIFKKNDGYTVLIPLSRQQEKIDMVLANLQTNKMAKYKSRLQGHIPIAPQKIIYNLA